MELTAGQLSLLRSEHPHRVSYYLSVLAPHIDYDGGDSADILYAGTVNGAHDRGARTVTVIDVVGTLAGIAEPTSGYTVLVGDTAAGGGGPGIGGVSRRRLRDVDIIGDNDVILDTNGIVWANGQYITVVRNWELWPIFPRILRAAPFTFYKDYDIVYDAGTAADANLEPFPVAIAGSHWAGFLDGASVTVTLDGSDSYGVAPGATISTYLWQSSGGAIANANIATTTITFNAVGTYWAYLTVTDSNGKVQKTRRAFMVHDRSANAPYSGFGAVVNLSYDRGNTLSISSFEDTSLSDWPDQALVILWAEEWYDVTEESIGYLADREHIKFIGYLDKETIAADPEDTGRISFDAHSIDWVLGNTMMFSVALGDTTAAPANWYTYFNLTTMRAIHHLWRWHSTLFSINDVFLPTANTLRRSAMDWPQGSLLSQARLTAWDEGIYAEIGCDKLGRVHTEVNPQFIWEADRGGIDVVMSLNDTDWFDEYTLIREERNQIAQASLSGMSHDGTTNTPYFAMMPGYDAGVDYDFIPEVRGDLKDDPNRLLDDQTDANRKVGLMYARANNDIPEIRMTMAENYTFMDVYPQEYYQMTIAAGDNKRGFTMTNRKCIPRQVNFRFGDGVIAVDAIFEPETVDVVAGVAWQYPTTIPDAPDPEPPQWPDLEGVGRVIVAFTDDDGMQWTQDAGANWAKRNTGAGVDDIHGYFDPWGIVTYGYNPENAVLWKFGVGYIYRSVNGGKTWKDVTPTTDPPDNWGDAPTPSDLTYEMGTPDWTTQGQHFVIAWYTDAGAYRGYLLTTDNNGASWTWYALGGDTQTVATWGYGDSINSDLWCDDTDAGNPVRTIIAPDNILVENGASGGVRVDFTARADNTALFQRILLVDFGTWFQLDPGTVDGGVNFQARMVSSADTMTIADVTNVGFEIELTRLFWQHCLDDGQENFSWTGGVDGYPFGVPSIKNKAANEGDFVRYAWLSMEAPAPARYRGTGYHQHLLDYIKVYPSAVNNEVRPLSIDIDRENGKFLYVTTWEGLAIRCRIYDMTVSLTYPVCIIELQWNVGRIDMEQRDYWANVKASRDATWSNWGDKFLLYGLFNAGNHIWSAFMVNDKFYNVDTPAFGGDDGSWGVSEWIGSLEWLEKDHIVAIMNSNVGANPEVWETLDYAATWNLRSNIGFGSGAGLGCDYDGMTIHNGTAKTMIVGDRNGDEIFKQDHPWTGAWTDISPAGAIAIRNGSLRWLFNDIP